MKRTDPCLVVNGGLSLTVVEEIVRAASLLVSLSLSLSLSVFLSFILHLDSSCVIISIFLLSLLLTFPLLSSLSLYTHTWL